MLLEERDTQNNWVEGTNTEQYGQYLAVKVPQCLLVRISQGL